MVKAFESQPQPQPNQQSQRSFQSQPVVKETISQKQYQDLQTRAKQNDYSTAGFAKLLAKFGLVEARKSHRKLISSCGQKQLIVIKLH
jgi:hypothetical protein